MSEGFKYGLGQVATDAVSRLSGVIVSRTDFISGQARYAIQPDAKDGKFEDERWFDEDRLIVDAGGDKLTLPLTPISNHEKHLSA